MQAINYDKYLNMNEKQIAISLKNAKKRVLALQEKYRAKIAQENQLIDFLKSKISQTQSTKYNFIPYKECQSYKIARQIEKTRTPQEQAKLNQEVDELINKDYGDEL